ncbi:MAG TPA: hypothetical protein GXX75_13580 [Clostridiales bacterium]|nr:hypothetical protein [Clostridiales bacterium]
MFDFFKRKQDTSTEVLSMPNEEKNDHANDASKIGFGYAATESARNSVQQAAKRFAKPSTYTGNRNLYDSGGAKKQAKLNLFKDEAEVIDPYTGNKLVLTKQEARMMYGDEWQKHLAESDHVKPLEQIYKDTKDNVWATTDDINNAANSYDNIRVSSRKFNNPKRSRTNKEYVENEEYLQSKGVELTEGGRQIAIRDGEIAEKSTSKQINNASTKNAIKTGHEAGKYGAKNAGVTALTMSGIMNFVAVVNGKKSSDEAIVDTIKDGGKAAVTGYAMGGGLTVVSHSLSNSSSKFIQALSKSNVPGKVITAVIVTGDTLKRYGNGEITTQECLIELGDKGLNLATMGYSMAVGQALIPIPIVGGAIGALVGSALTSTYYNNLINTLQTKQLEHKERQRIIEECNKAAEQTKVFREELEDYLKSYFKEYKDCFNEALSSIRFAYQAGDADGIITGANQITRKLGGQVHYETVKEFKRFLDDDLIDIL